MVARRGGVLRRTSEWHVGVLGGGGDVTRDG